MEWNSKHTLCSCVFFWFGFGMCWACDIEGDGDERRESVEQVFLGRRKRKGINGEILK